MNSFSNTISKVHHKIDSAREIQEMLNNDKLLKMLVERELLRPISKFFEMVHVNSIFLDNEQLKIVSKTLFVGIQMNKAMQTAYPSRNYFTPNMYTRILKKHKHRCKKNNIFYHN